MKSVAISVLAAVALAVAGQPAQAQSMHGSMAMPACGGGDAVVGMNTTTRVYMTHDQMKARTAGMSDGQVHAMMTNDHIRLVCMSRAKAMGGRMMSMDRVGSDERTGANTSFTPNNPTHAMNAHDNANDETGANTAPAPSNGSSNHSNSNQETGASTSH